MEILPLEILRKEPFKRIAPDARPTKRITSGTTPYYYPPENTSWEILSQADFLREYDVAGHKINSTQYYPNKWTKDENGNHIEQIVSRVALPYQSIITTKHLVHLCGNDIEIKLSNPFPSDQEEELRSFFKQGWIDKDMEVAWYGCAKSDKITGDTAFCAYLNEGKFGYVVFSYLNGDTLYPHYDRFGNLSVFGRRYSKYDEKGKEYAQYLEVWDDRFMYRYKCDQKGIRGAVNSVKKWFGLDGWREIEPPEPHNFNRIPIAYHRSGAPCWGPSQDNIDAYEMAISQLCENNKAYALRILFTKGQSIDMKATIDGRPLAIDSTSSDADAKFLEPADSSASFELQLKVLDENIMRGAFAVRTPEVKGSDISGLAVKLLFADAYQRALLDSIEYDGFVNDMIELFKYGYGVETSRITDFSRLSIKGNIVPYMYLSETEEVSNLVQLKSVGILSGRSASEAANRIGYGVNAEWMRVLKEEREKIVAGNTVQETTSTSTQVEGAVDNVVNRTRTEIEAGES